MKTGFFTALRGVCCGTAVFPLLKRNSGARAVWHLALMALLCTLLVSLRMIGEIRREWTDCAGRFDAVFGSRIAFSAASGIVPIREPERPRRMAIPRSGLLIYTANSPKLELPAEALSASDYLIVWGARCFGVAMRLDERRWDVQILRPDRKIVREQLEDAGVAGFFDRELARSAAPGRKRKFADEVDVGVLFKMLSLASQVVWFLSEWLGIFLLGIVCTGFFAAISRLTGAARIRGLSGWEYWRIGVYAGFPGMLIGAAAEALELPFLHYGLVYSLALVVYWLPAALACTETPEAPHDAPPRG